MALHSQNSSSIMYKGVYSKRYEIFYQNNPDGNPYSVMYHNL